MLLTKTEAQHHVYVRVLQPGEEAYDYLLSHFDDIVGQPPLTVVAVKTPKEQRLDETMHIIARYCLEQAFQGQTCLATNHHSIDGEVFFVQDGNDYVVTDVGHFHALGHLVLAVRHELAESDSHNGDRLFQDDYGKVLVFTGALPPQELYQLMEELESDLEALWRGDIQGWIERLTFRPSG